MSDKKKGCFTISDCGCEAIQWCESDGSEWIDFRMCKLHESAEALQAENERLVKLHDGIATNLEKRIEKLENDDQEFIRLQAENERLRAALIESTKFIINTSIPYREGYIWSLIHDRVSDNYAALGYIFPALGYGANHEE